MQTLNYIYFEENGMWIGWLEQYPDYRSQGRTVEELEENLRDLYSDLVSGEIPGIRQVGTITIP